MSGAGNGNDGHAGRSNQPHDLVEPLKGGSISSSQIVHYKIFVYMFVDLDERVVGGDLPNESHDEAEEYAPLSAMQELHPSSCAGAKECYTGLSLPQEKMIPKKAHIEKFDRVNQGSAESTLPDKQITTQELHPIFLREPKRITLVYLCHTWLLRTHALKSLIRPIKAVQNQPKRVTPIMEVQNQLCRIEQITAQELHPSFSSRTKEDYTGSSLPRMVAKILFDSVVNLSGYPMGMGMGANLCPWVLKWVGIDNFSRNLLFSRISADFATPLAFSLTLSALCLAALKLDWRLSQEKPSVECDEAELDPKYRESVKCKIFLGFTSNLVSSGIRDVIRFLVQHHMVDVIVTSAGGIEEDLIKCLGPTYRGDFSLPGALLRSKGLNRIGNLLLPNDNYCKFEKWIMPVLDQMLLEQSTKNVWTPSKVIGRLGKEINDESSYLYWAHKFSQILNILKPILAATRKNNIPVYCPALTDGSIGDMLFCHAVHNPGLIIDIVQDVRLMNDEAIHATPRKTGVIILGGGLPKHHICNANMLRNGADYAVYINTAQEFDGSDSGAHPDEAVSWGKIKGSAKPVKNTAALESMHFYET
uniref:Deoxyhypusine synthase n=1 Tax=Aegilops tauschii TaxID=37682 RepID=R7WCY9_AEGTA